MDKKNSKIGKTIICLYAPANCGKTESIRSLFLKLGGDKKVINETHDFVAIVLWGNKKIGFASQGDPGTPQEENLEKLVQSGCDIIVTASRTKGNTVYSVCDIANMHGYSVVWISPFYYNDVNNATDETEELYRNSAERNSDNIAKLIMNISN